MLLRLHFEVLERGEGSLVAVHLFAYLYFHFLSASTNHSAAFERVGEMIFFEYLCFHHCKMASLCGAVFD
jgi:hypothetical protein